MQKAGVIGCGWLGLPLAKRLILNNFSVKGTTTQRSNFSDLINATIQPYVFVLGEGIDLDFLKELDFLIICFPITNKLAPEFYETFVQELAAKVEPTTKIIFTSSTSVYVQNQNDVDEQNGLLDSNSINLKVEQFLQKHLKNELTILRLGGLIGENRHPIHTLAGRKDIPSGNAPVNLVHQKDVIQAIYTVIVEHKFNTIFNCVFPFHPPKKEYYSDAALLQKLTPPTFLTDNSTHKIVNGVRIVTSTTFRYNFHP